MLHIVTGFGEVLFLLMHVVQETHHEMRIPESDVMYIVLSVYLLKLIDGCQMNRYRTH